MAKTILVTPVAKTGLHCGKVVDPSPSPNAVPVTPVAKTGLHCGRLYEVAEQDAESAGDPGREDRAPLRRWQGRGQRWRRERR